MVCGCFPSTVLYLMQVALYVRHNKKAFSAIPVYVQHSKTALWEKLKRIYTQTHTQSTETGFSVKLRFQCFVFSEKHAPDESKKKTKLCKHTQPQFLLDCKAVIWLWVKHSLVSAIVYRAEHSDHSCAYCIWEGISHCHSFVEISGCWSVSGFKIHGFYGCRFNKLCCSMLNSDWGNANCIVEFFLCLGREVWWMQYYISC